MQHVREAKYREQRLFNLRYHRIDQSYNIEHLTTAVTREELRRAYVTVKSRGIDWEMPSKTPRWFLSPEADEKPDCSALVPVFDMWNHHDEPNCQWKVSQSPRAIEVVATKRVNAGEELFVSYGASASTNKKRARIYGFTISEHSKPEGFTDFSDMEILLACQHVLGVSEKECARRINAPDPSVIHNIASPAYIDSECNPSNEFFKYLVFDPVQGAFLNHFFGAKFKNLN